MRRTKIIATMGPASTNPVILDGLMAVGVDVFRLNAAHAGPPQLDVVLRQVRAAALRAGREVGVLVDLPGPKIRVGEIESGVVLEKASEFSLFSKPCVGDSHHACVTYEGLATDVHPGDRVLLDDGRLELVVTGAADQEVMTRVVIGGPLLSNKGVNFPDVTLSLDSVTPYDLTVLEWAMSADIDWIGQSFVRCAQDIAVLREAMARNPIPILAKIEKHEAAELIGEIVGAADAVMVARGDLAVETAPERVPVLQRAIVAAARAAGKPVVIATEMLDSMRERPRPTRAEASDVAGAIFIRADAVMLSGETAVGLYPVEAAETMARIAVAAEEAAPPPRPPHTAECGVDVQVAVSAAVSELAADLELAAIVTLTQSGATALAVSRYRPPTPIVAATPRVEVARMLQIAWGVRAVTLPFADQTDQRLDDVAGAVRDQGFAVPGQRIAITAGLWSRVPGGTDFLHVREII